MLRTIIWVLLTVILVAFAAMNWDPVDVKIWPATDADNTLVWSTKLPAVILLSFLVGFLPTWFALRAARWSLKRRLDSSERQLADLRAMANRTPEAATDPSPPSPPVNDISPLPLDPPTVNKP